MRGGPGARPSDTASLALRPVTLFSVGLIDPLAVLAQLVVQEFKLGRYTQRG